MCGRPWGQGVGGTACQHPALLAGRADLQGPRDKSKQVSGTSTQGARPQDTGDAQLLHPNPVPPPGLPRPDSGSAIRPELSTTLATTPALPPTASSPPPRVCRPLLLVPVRATLPPGQSAPPLSWDSRSGCPLIYTLPASVPPPGVFPAAKMNLSTPRSDSPFPEHSPPHPTPGLRTLRGSQLTQVKSKVPTVALRPRLPWPCPLSGPPDSLGSPSMGLLSAPGSLQAHSHHVRVFPPAVPTAATLFPVMPSTFSVRPRLSTPHPAFPSRLHFPP